MRWRRKEGEKLRCLRFSNFARPPALFARPPSSPARPLRPPALFGVRNPILSLETFLTQNKTKQNETKRPRIWWSAACVPALRAIASGSAGASAFSPDGGAGLAGFLPKKPINLVATFHGGPDAAVSAAESSAEAALSRVAPAPAHPLFLLRSDGVIKGAVDGKMAQKLETIYDAAASRILDEEGSSPPFVVCIMRSKNKEGMLEQIAELVAPKLGLPAPDAGKSTWVAGAVGKNWFEGDGGGGSSFVEPSDADAQFALQAGFGNVLEMPEAFGEREKERERESCFFSSLTTKPPLTRLLFFRDQPTNQNRPLRAQEVGRGPPRLPLRRPRALP